MLARCALASLLLLAILPSHARSVLPAELDMAYDELDGFELISALLRDQKYNDAERLLPREGAKLSPTQQALLRGRLHLGREQWRDAADAFENAAKGSERVEALELWAESLERQEQWAACRVIVQRVGDAESSRRPERALRASRCQRLAGDAAGAWKALRRLGPEANSLSVASEEAQVLLDLNLRHEAQRRAFAFVRARPDAQSAIALSEVFERAGLASDALRLLEAAQLLQPREADLLLAAVGHYQKRGWNLGVERALERAHALGGDFAHPIAELQRLRGAKATHYYWLLQNKEMATQRRQRAALWVESGNWPLLATLAPDVSAASADDEVDYAVGYALHVSGQRSAAQPLLTRLKNPGLRAKAEALLR